MPWGCLIIPRSESRSSYDATHVSSVASSLFLADDEATRGPCERWCGEQLSGGARTFAMSASYVTVLLSAAPSAMALLRGALENRLASAGTFGYNEVRSFRGLTTAAPLKRPEGVPDSDVAASFRGLTTAAPLKLFDAPCSRITFIVSAVLRPRPH